MTMLSDRRAGLLLLCVVAAACAKDHEAQTEVQARTLALDPSVVWVLIAEDELLLPAYDPAYRAGTNHADDHSFTIPVDDNQLDIRFSPRSGQPFINALRVTHRPDL